MAAHAHDHHHHHGAHGAAPAGRAFVIGIALQTTFIAVEVIVGFFAHSLAVLADAGHNVSDVLALALAWGATRLAARRASKGRTYGWKSASILAALANALTLVFVSGAVAWEAILRLVHPATVATTPVMVISLVGVVVNGFCAWLFVSGKGDKHEHGATHAHGAPSAHGAPHTEDANIRAAFLHLASDAVVAAGVALAGLLIRLTGLEWIDPITSLVVSVVIIATTWRVLKRAMGLALHAVPENIDEDAVRAWLLAQPNVTDVHDLHIWAMSTTESVLTAHLVVDRLPEHGLACQLDERLRHAFAIHHVTLQLESPTEAKCALASEKHCC